MIYITFNALSILSDSVKSTQKEMYSMRWKWRVGGQRGYEEFRNRYAKEEIYKNKMRNDKAWKVRGRVTETLSGKTKNGSDRAGVQKKKVGRAEPQKITNSHAS